MAEEYTGKIITEGAQEYTGEVRPLGAPQKSVGEKAKSTAIDVADILPNLLVGATGLGANLATRVKSSIQMGGATSPEKYAKAAQAGSAAQAAMMELYGDPVKKIVEHVSGGKPVEPGAVGHVMGRIGELIQMGSEKASAATGGKVPKEDFQTLADVAQLFGPVMVGRMIGKVLKPEAPPPGEMPAALKKYAGEETREKPRGPSEAPAEEKIPVGEATELEERPPASLQKVPPAAPPEKIPTGEATEMSQREIAEYQAEQSLQSARAKMQAGTPEALTLSERQALRRGMQVIKGGGKADVALLSKMALAGGGALLASRLADEDKLEAAIAGGLGGVAVARLPRYVEALKEDWRGTAKTTATVAGVTAGMTALDKDHPIEGAMLGLIYGATRTLPRTPPPEVGNMPITDLINARNGALAVREREIGNVADGLRTLVPNPARLAAIGEAIDKGDLSGLKGQELVAARVFKNFTRSYGEAAQDEGLIRDLIQNYVTHIVEKEGLPKSVQQQTMDALFGSPERGVGPGGVSTRSPFLKQRKYATFEDLERALKGTGLQVKTKNIADITEIYGRSMARAIENKRLVDNLRAFREGEPAYIAPDVKAPPDYVYVNTPQLRGMRVHPELAPHLKFVMESHNPSEAMKALVGLTLAQKRLATSLSLFHANNLMNAYAAAAGTDVLKGFGPINTALKVWREGGNGDTIDQLLKGGLKIGKPMETDVRAMTQLGKLMDSYTQRATGMRSRIGERSLGAVEKLQMDTFDRATWDYLHTGMKLAIATRELERARAKDSKAGPPDVPRLAAQVSSYVNSTFGGLDWYRVATETQNALARKMALDALSPRGRQVLQLGMFAPDWTLSTFRSVYKALPGATDMPLTQTLHQKYVLRSALMYLTLMNAYNRQVSGHNIWENVDAKGEPIPYKIQYADGTTQQVAKHAMESMEWTFNPRQTALNKLGFPIKEPLELLTDKEYLSTRGAPPIDSRTEHVLRSVVPIPGQSLTQPGLDTREALWRAALSAVGLPIYGLDEDQKAALKEERRAAREERKRKKEEAAQ